MKGKTPAKTGQGVWEAARAKTGSEQLLLLKADLTMEGSPWGDTPRVLDPF